MERRSSAGKSQNDRAAVRVVELRAEGAKRGELHQEGMRAVKKNGGLIDLVAGIPGCNTKLWKTSMLYTHSHANTPPRAASDLNGRMYFKRMTNYVELEITESAEILNK